MNDRQKNLQHAMLSFALMGGMLVNTKATQQVRSTSAPSDFNPYRIGRRK